MYEKVVKRDDVHLTPRCRRALHAQHRSTGWRVATEREEREREKKQYNMANINPRTHLYINT